MTKPSPPDIEKFAAEKQLRMDDLLDRNCERNITVDEREELTLLVIEAERLMMINAQRAFDYFSSTQ